MRIDIYHHDARPEPCCAHVSWTIGQPTNKRQRRYTLDLTCNTAQKIHVHFKPVGDSGRPTKFDGEPTVSVTDGNGTFAVDNDGLGLYVISPDEPGDTNYLVEADGDLGSGVETIQLAIALHCQGENAKSFGATADAPEAK